MKRRGNLASVTFDVMAELTRARERYPRKQSSPHEAWAILREEVDELWDEVKGKHPERNERMYGEAVQVAAMALRFLLEACDGEDEAQ